MSRTPRFFVPELEGATISLPPEEAHHLLHVLRLRQGSAVELFDGKGRGVSGAVREIRGRSVLVEVLATLESRDSPHALSLAVAVPKGDRMTWTVQKLTELGVRRLIPLLTERGDVRGNAVGRGLTRWRRVALESCKQSGRSLLPELTEPQTLEEALTAHAGVKLLAQPAGGPLPSVEPSTGVLALIGPEGGWSEAEIELAAARGAVSFGLGPRILRTETAAIAVAVRLQSIAGDL